VSAGTIQLQQSTIREYAKQLHLPIVGGQFAKLAEEAIQQKQGHVAFLEVLLRTELEERERNAIARRIHEAKFPKVKTFAYRHHFGMIIDITSECQQKPRRDAPLR
jgi:DNA replication protein DnaC